MFVEFPPRRHVEDGCGLRPANRPMHATERRWRWQEQATLLRCCRRSTLHAYRQLARLPGPSIPLPDGPRSWMCAFSASSFWIPTGVAISILLALRSCLCSPPTRWRVLQLGA